MTPEELNLEAIKARAEAATPEHWEAHYHSGPNIEDLANWVRQALSQAPNSLVLEIVTTGAPNEEGVCPPGTGTVAVTGNGPTSRANADFIAHARTDIPALVAEVERLRSALSLAADHLENASRRMFDSSHYGFCAELGLWAQQARAALGKEA